MKKQNKRATGNSASIRRTTLSRPRIEQVERRVMLANWEPIGTFAVDLSGHLTRTPITLELGAQYKVVAEGTAQISPTGFRGDAAFARTNEIPSETTRDGKKIDLGVTLSGQMPVWGQFSDTHRYETLLTGDGKRLNIGFQDSVYNDNVNDGSLQVTLYRVPTQVYLTVLDADATETAGDEAVDKGKIRITREGGSMSQQLLVSFQLLGATEDDGSHILGDFERLGQTIGGVYGWTVAIPAGQTSLDLEIIPIQNDAGFEGEEPVNFSLATGSAAYTLASEDPATTPGTKPSSGQVVIRDGQIGADVGQAGTNGGEVASVQPRFAVSHYVSPKSANDAVVVKASVPTGKSFTDLYVWEGGDTVAGSPEKRKVSRDTPGRLDIKILDKKTNKPVFVYTVWIVWANLTASFAIGSTSFIDGTPLGLHGGRVVADNFYRPKAGIDWTATITPAAVITAVDRPALEGQTRSNPPGENGGVPSAQNNDATGSGFSGWDFTRRKRRQVIKGNPLLGVAMAPTTQADEVLGFDPVDYPINELEGNDDSSADLDEDSNPYDSGQGVPGKGTVGTLRVNDEPMRTLADGLGQDGDVYRMHMQFGEFVRVQIGNVWYRVSDIKDWRWHMNAKKSNGMWNAELGQADVVDDSNADYGF